MMKDTMMVQTQQDIFARPDPMKMYNNNNDDAMMVDTVKSPQNGRRSEEQRMKRVQDLNSSCWSLKYQIEDPDFAKGAYGKVLLARDKTNGERVVIKKIPQSTPIRMVNNEVRAGKIIGIHENIAGLLQYVDKPDFHFLVFQFIQGQDLFSYLEKTNFSPRTESDARYLINQILNALKHIHSLKVAHRDIKLENLLIDPKTGKITVIDLGLCAFMEDGKLCREWCGSDNYLAPEIVRRIPYNGYQADIFSTGVVLFALLFGVFPFENLRVNGPVLMDGHRQLKKLQVRFPIDVKVSNSAKDLISQMLEDDPEKRITLANVLRHEWVMGDKYESQSSKKMSCESVMQSL